MYLEAAVKQVFTGNNVRDLGLVEAMGDGRGSQGGVEGDNYHVKNTSDESPGEIIFSDELPGGLFLCITHVGNCT